MGDQRGKKRGSCRYLCLAGGTNLLISDEGFDGLVLRPDDAGKTSMKGTTVTSRAPVYAMSGSFEGICRGAFAYRASNGRAALPGTLGGAVRGNAGCFGGEIKDSVAIGAER
jgi:UDP-N-acetylmuramate dehydrogenase